MDLDSSSDTSSVALADAGLSTTPASEAFAPGSITVVDTRTEVATSILVSASLVKAIAGWASKDATRFPLCGVLVDGTVLVATDGHRLIKVAGVPSGGSAGEKPPTATYIVPVAPLLAAVKLAGAKGLLQIGLDDAGKLLGTIHCIGPEPKFGVRVACGAVPFKAIDAKFPPYEQVLPKPEEYKHGRIALNAAYLAATDEVCRALDAVSDRSHDGVIIESAGGLDPIVLTYAGATMVIMPMRIAGATPAKEVKAKRRRR